MVKISASRMICEIAKRTTASVVVAGTLLVCMGVAQAQTAVPVQHPLSIKLGALFPTSNSGSDNGGSAQISAGADYAIGKTTQNNPALPSVYFDYNGGSRRGGHVNTYGLGLAIRAYANAPSGANRQAVSPYYGAGIGVYHVDVKDARYAPYTRSGQTTSVGGKIFAGLEFSGDYFVEANYQFLPSKAGVNPSGVGVQIGVRF